MRFQGHTWTMETAVWTVVEIPFEIWIGGFDHRLPYEGDNGIRFEPNPDVAGVWAGIPIENDAD